MSSSNVLRLWTDALRAGEKVDLMSADAIQLRPVINDTGALNVGDGTHDMDVKVFLGSATEYVLFDVGNSRLEVACDFKVTQPVIAAEHGAGAIGTAFAPRTRRWTENGTIVTQIEIDLTGLGARGTENDIIGLESGTPPAYIGRNVVATNGIIYRVEMTCLEVPLTGDADVILCAGSAGDQGWDAAVTNRIAICDGTGDWTLGETNVNETTAITANYYYYLTQGAADDADYTAGQFLIRFYGHPALSA